MSTKSYPVIDMIATGKNIVRLRKSLGLSVADLQSFFGFEAPQAIYKWQSGKSLPSTDNLYALSHLFEVTIEEILVPSRPVFQVLPQEKSCGSGRFGGYNCYFVLKMFLYIFYHVLFSLKSGMIAKDVFII